MRPIVAILIFLFSMASQGKELPPWVEKSSKLQSYEQLVEWMKLDKFYRVSKTESKEIKIESGQTAQETEIFFDDVSGCNDRKLISTCVPIGLDTDHPALFCQNLLTNCTGKSLSRSTVVH